LGRLKRRCENCGKAIRSLRVHWNRQTLDRGEPLLIDVPSTRLVVFPDILAKFTVARDYLRGALVDRTPIPRSQK
jgi:hypothetical protein